MPVIFLLCGIGLLVYVTEKIYKKLWTKDLDVILQFWPEPSREGEKGHLTEIVKNSKKLPVPLLNVKFETSRNLQFVNQENVTVSDKTYKNDLFAVMPYQQIKRTLIFECKKRGYYSIEKAELVSGFLSFSQLQYDRRKQETSIYVYPGLLDIPALWCFLSQVTYALLSRNRLFEDPFSFAGIREYQPGDALKLVNWNASAKAQQLMVNVREYCAGQPVVILVNLEPTLTWHMDAVLEESIRLACTAAAYFMKEGIPVSLCTTYDAILPEPILSPAALDEMNKRMAVLDLNKGCAKYSEWAGNVVMTERTTDASYLVISHDESERMQEATAAMADYFGEIWQICPHLYGQEASALSDKIHMFERVVDWHG